MKIQIGGDFFDVIFPATMTDTHEGGLNTLNVEIRHLKRKEPFQPFTIAKFNGESWVIDSDSVTYEPMIRRYNHSISLCEEVKLLEKYICGAKTFSIPKNQYLGAFTVYPQQTVETWTEDTETSEIHGYNKSENGVTDNGEILYPFMSPYILPVIGVPALSIPATVFKNDQIASEIRGAFYIINDGGEPVEITEDVFLTNISPNDVVKVSYFSQTSEKITQSSYYKYTKTTYTYTISVQEKAIERKQLTICEVANILLHTYEAFIISENATFVIAGFDGKTSQITPLALNIPADDIPCPEISFANGSTLKENLDQLAILLHAKVRMRDGRIFFERLTKNEQAELNGIEIDGSDSFTSEKFGGEVQTFAQNVVNYNESEGTVSDVIPRTLRAEEGKVRINDENGLIATDFPIEKIVSCVFVQNDGNEIDISEKVIEETQYNTLSSYGGAACKANFIYYSQGKNDIKGLFFKDADLKPSGDTFKNYAIENVIGQSISTDGIKDMAFKVSYIPIVNLRICTPRQDWRGGNTSYIMNQSENRVDSNSMGRKMQSTAAQITSNSPKKTYVMKKGDNLPVVGKQFDKDNYISAMSVQFFPTYTKCTINVTENYNKYSDFVQIPQAIRQYEIDVNSVQDRHILYRDYCNISYEKPMSNSDCALNSEARGTFIVSPFAVSRKRNVDYRVRLARAVTANSFDKSHGVTNLTSNFTTISSCIFPCISLGFGNSILFLFKYSDNFSAGRKAITREGLKFNEQSYAPYGDNFGAADLLQFKFYNGGTTANIIESGRAFPDDSVYNTLNDYEIAMSGGYGEESKYIHLCKDSRETINVEYQLVFGSDSGIFVGADYCENNPLVRTVVYEDDPEIRFYNHYIDPVKGTTEESDLTVPNKKTFMVVSEDNGIYSIAPYENVPDHKAWAIVSNDGKFFMGSNKPYEKNLNGTGKQIYFTFQHRR